MVPVTSTRRKWSENDLHTALRTIRSKEMSIRAASVKFCIPRTTLRDYLKKSTSEVKRVGRKSVLTTDQENELKQRIFRLCDVGFPLTKKDLRKAVFQFCEENKIQNPFNSSKRTAGKSDYAYLHSGDGVMSNFRI